MDKFKLREDADPQLYGIGLKEVWEVDANHPLFKPGYIQHSVGWPLDPKTYAGSFLYHMAPNYIHIGLVVGLNYKNPYINPYE
jgi:electron-transferring-flavoprotein dehydrogenase